MTLKISLKAARINAGLTQEAVAAMLKKSKVTIINWEKGKTSIDKGNFDTQQKSWENQNNLSVLDYKENYFHLELP